jgi:hypothetical protein
MPTALWQKAPTASSQRAPLRDHFSDMRSPSRLARGFCTHPCEPGAPRRGSVRRSLTRTLQDDKKFPRPAGKLGHPACTWASMRQLDDQDAARRFKGARWTAAWSQGLWETESAHCTENVRCHLRRFRAIASISAWSGGAAHMRFRAVGLLRAHGGRRFGPERRGAGQLEVVGLARKAFLHTFRGGLAAAEQ